MTKSEILQVAKPILFNTEMVRAILDGRKTVTRRLIKPRYRDDEYGFCVCTNKGTGEVTVEKMDEDEGTMFPDGNTRYVNPPYKPGQYLYVRETWDYCSCANCDGDIDIGVCSKRENGREPIGCYIYRADEDDVKWDDGKTHWKPSIHMLKEVARIFLKVTDVRVEKLQDITEEQAMSEGIYLIESGLDAGYYTYVSNPVIGFCWDTARNCFRGKLWNATIKKKDLDMYGWEANPWVWVIGFERVEVDG